MVDTLNHQDMLNYVKDNPVAIIGTVNAHNQPHGAAVYVVVGPKDRLYFVTKNETIKYKNILHNPKISITIVNTQENSSLQAEGRALVVEDMVTIQTVMEKLTHVYVKSVDWLPPLAKISAGPYEVVGIELGHAKLAHFLGKHAGDRHIYQES